MSVQPGIVTTKPSTEQRHDTDYRLDEGDHERFSHYAEKDKITESMVTGTPITALCGKVWVPSRDPKRFPVCPTCKELFDMGPEGRVRFWRERMGGSGEGGAGEQ